MKHETTLDYLLKQMDWKTNVILTILFFVIFMISYSLSIQPPAYTGPTNIYNTIFVWAGLFFVSWFFGGSGYYYAKRRYNIESNN